MLRRPIIPSFHLPACLCLSHLPPPSTAQAMEQTPTTRTWLAVSAVACPGCLETCASILHVVIPKKKGWDRTKRFSQIVTSVPPPAPATSPPMDGGRGYSCFVTSTCGKWPYFKRYLRYFVVLWSSSPIACYMSILSLYLCFSRFASASWEL